jgi:GNAT superfamily N-acetyltransferase
MAIYYFLFENEGNNMNGFTIKPAELHHLRAINRVIESAVLNWPTEKRMKRLAVPTLQYDAVDLDHYTVLVGELNDEVVAVAAWDPESNAATHAGGLFHGLYVLPILQRLGLGRHLMDAVFESASERGLPGLLFKAQRVSRAYFERQGLELKASNEDEYPWQYWKRLGG